VQTFTGSVDLTTLHGFAQSLALGPVASQEAIKQLGTNGGGFFNVNSAFPFENATTFSNFVELLFILLIPAAATYQYGKMIGKVRQGWALYVAMLVMFGIGLGNAYYQEAKATPALAAAGVHATVSPGSTGGNLQDKGATGVTFADLLGGGVMLLGRFIPLLAALAVAGSLAASGRRRRGRGRSGPTRRSFWCCWSGWR
jgi:K+-transporting ATPase A subunit